MGPARPQRRPADPAHRRRSSQSQSSVRGGARPPVRSQRGARHLPIARRRQDVSEGALQGREHGRQRRRHRPGRSERRVRHALGGAARPVGERRLGGHRGRDLQVDRRRHHVEAAHQRAPPGDSGQPCHLAGRPPAALRGRRIRRTAGIERQPRDDGHLPQRRCGPVVDAHHDRRQAVRAHRRRRPAGADSPPEAGRHRDHGGHRVVEDDRRRQDLVGLQGRARRRRLSERLDQPGQPRHRPAGGRSGRGRHAQRRRHVEFLVQPVDRAALSRGRRQRVPVPRVQRAAGERISLRGEPRQLRRDLEPRLAPGWRGRVRLRGPRSPEPGHRLRGTERVAVRPPHGTGVQRRPGGRTRRGRGGHARPGPIGPHDAGGLLRGRQGLALLREQLPVEDDGRRRALVAHQPGSHAPDVGDAGKCRQVPRRCVRQTPAARRHLHDCAVLSGRQAHLGRHRRRARPRHRRRRAHLERRDATGRRAVGEDLPDRRRPLQPADRLCRRQHASASTTCGRTSTARTTAAPRGPRS